MHDVLAVGAGICVGFALGLTGGGGSILAVPLLLYIAGVSDPHMAIGTGGLAVCLTALFNLISHARRGHVRWPVGLVFALFGVIGAAVGSTIGKAVDGHELLMLFAVMMIVVAVLLQRSRRSIDRTTPPLTAARAGRLGTTGLSVGMLAGFFGIGGGFLIVPGLVFSGDLATIDAIGSSLISVTGFSFMTAANYAVSGQVAWKVGFEFVLGGALGGFGGAQLARRLSKSRMMLNRVFGGVLVLVAGYILIRGIYGPLEAVPLAYKPFPDVRNAAGVAFDASQSGSSQSAATTAERR